MVSQLHMGLRQLGALFLQINRNKKCMTVAVAALLLVSIPSVVV
jgi:hypothetical protein